MKENKEDYVIDGKWIYSKNLPEIQYYLPNLICIRIDISEFVKLLYVDIVFSNGIVFKLKSFSYKSEKVMEKYYRLATEYIKQFQKQIKDII